MDLIADESRAGNDCWIYEKWFYDEGASMIVAFWRATYTDRVKSYAEPCATKTEALRRVANYLQTHEVF